MDKRSRGMFFGIFLLSVPMSVLADVLPATDPVAEPPVSSTSTADAPPVPSSNRGIPATDPVSGEPGISDMPAGEARLPYQSPGFSVLPAVDPVGIQPVYEPGQLLRVLPAVDPVGEPALPDAAVEEAVVLKSPNPWRVSRTSLFAGANLLSFDYTEFDTDGGWLDDEAGVLPGMRVGGRLDWPGQWYAIAQLDYFSGEVDYRGQTQSSNPALSGLSIVSRSDADIFDTTLIAGRRFENFSLYGGLGYYFWRRNIQPTQTAGGLSVAGVLEFYSWTYALLGVEIPLLLQDKSEIEVDVRLTRMLQANMEVDFLGYGGYDNVMLNLNEEWGLRLALPWTLTTFSEGVGLVIEPYYVRWNLGRSVVRDLTINGASTGSQVVEPDSETRNFGLSVYFSISM